MQYCVFTIDVRTFAKRSASLINVRTSASGFSPSMCLFASRTSHIFKKYGNACACKRSQTTLSFARTAYFPLAVMRHCRLMLDTPEKGY
ncbi:MAG: hypothetical protein KJ963_02490 [Bacteroidetes bacterium]|nr:hypothetical protein [Bacteroidota bacterium]